MTTWHYILIGGSGLAILAFTLHRWLAPRLPVDTTDAPHVPEAEADARFVTKVKRGSYHTHVF